MNLLLLLSLHGSLLFAFVWVLDRKWHRDIVSFDRRWWWMAIPISFLVFIPLPSSFSFSGQPVRPNATTRILFTHADVLTEKAGTDLGLESNHVWWWIWATGTGAYLLAVMAQTRNAHSLGSRERLCTVSALLDLLEDCKRDAGVTAPIGLVVSEHLGGPAILGWLRPRILLPREAVSSLTQDQLRAVLFHELAHFRSLDLPLNWVFSLAAAVHWFNPLAHLAFRAWGDFRESAADEMAMAWMKQSSGTSYGQAFVRALQLSRELKLPFGALALSESTHQLKKRLVMINNYKPRKPHPVIAGFIFLALTAIFIARPIYGDDLADPRPAAVEAMQSWLHGIDDSQYAQSWADASPFFQKAITSDKWAEALNSARTPLGKCTGRVLLSALHQTNIPTGTQSIKGDFVVAQFKASFENLADAVETVTFEKTDDGSWKADGYYVKPRI